MKTQKEHMVWQGATTEQHMWRPHADVMTYVHLETPGIHNISSVFPVGRLVYFKGGIWHASSVLADEPL